MILKFLYKFLVHFRCLYETKGMYIYTIYMYMCSDDGRCVNLCVCVCVCVCVQERREKMQKSRRTSISTLRGAARDGKDKDAAKVLKVHRHTLITHSHTPHTHAHTHTHTHTHTNRVFWTLPRQQPARETTTSSLLELASP